MDELLYKYLRLLKEQQIIENEIYILKQEIAKLNLSLYRIREYVEDYVILINEVEDDPTSVYYQPIYDIPVVSNSSKVL